METKVSGDRRTAGVGPDAAGRDGAMAPGQRRQAAKTAALPPAVRRYLDHTEDGVSLRALARREGCHPSTVLRQVRRYENRRDDPLIDEALSVLGRRSARPPAKESKPMSAPIRPTPEAGDDAAILAEAPRILRRLAEAGATLAIAADMDRAVVLRADAGGRMIQTAVLDRSAAQALALRDWIACVRPGRVAAYAITAAGRAALRHLTGEASGFAEAQAPFGSPGETGSAADEGLSRGRYGPAESPVQTLARRRDAEGRAFLDAALVEAAERLREDFELAQMGPRVAQDWDRFLTGADRGPARPAGAQALGPRAARDRVALALRDLGPGLGDVALRCCCYLEGLETVERRLGWAARSGKIVLRIALQRLDRHYRETYGRSGPLIG